MKVCVGGTFDRLHIAHKALLSKAFEVGDEIFIGLATGSLTRKKENVSSFRARDASLVSYLRGKGYARFHVVPIGKRFGIADSADLDGIVVSEETNNTAQEINAARRKRGLKPLEIFIVEKVYADDMLPVSSTRIRDGEIDSAGRRLVPLAVHVGSLNKNKVNAVKNVLSDIFKNRCMKYDVAGIKVPSGVGRQPKSSRTIQGAINRAKKALKEADVGIGIEAGLFWNDYLERYLDVQYCAVLDKTGRLTIGHGGGFVYPDKIISEIHRGKTVGEAFGDIYGVMDIGYKDGAIGYLSRGLLTREKLTEQAVIMALIPRIAGMYK